MDKNTEHSDALYNITSSNIASSMMVSSVLEAIICLILVDYSKAITTDPQCPQGFSSVGNLCLKEITTAKQTFFEANASCHAIGAVLPLPLTNQEARDFHSHLSGGNWIGLRDVNSDDKYQMTNGQEFSGQYFDNWEGSISTSDTEDCVRMTTWATTFILTECSDQKYFSCSTPRIACRSPFNAIGNLCLGMYDDASRNASDAQLKCESIGGHLPFPTTSAEGEIIMDFGMSRYGPEPNIPIGFRTTDLSIPWTNQFDQSVATYLPWADLEPAAAGCVVLVTNEATMKLKTGECSVETKHFCQAPPSTCNVDYVSNGEILFEPLSNIIQVQCNDGFLLRGIGQTVCGTNGYPIRPIAPMCLALNPIITLTITMNYATQSGMHAFRIQAEDSDANCAIVCLHDERCVTAVWDEGSSDCLMYGRVIGDDEIEMKSNAYLLQVKG